MNEYKVSGYYETDDENGVTTRHYRSRFVDALSAADAEIEVDSELPLYATWIDNNPVVVETLASIERRALADWNAQRPTASPNALAMARGEL